MPRWGRLWSLLVSATARFRRSVSAGIGEMGCAEMELWFMVWMMILGTMLFRDSIHILHMPVRQGQTCVTFAPCRKANRNGVSLCIRHGNAPSLAGGQDSHRVPWRSDPENYTSCSTGQ